MNSNRSSRFSFFTEDNEPQKANTGNSQAAATVPQNIEKPANNQEFKPSARYRCSQINVTQVQGNVTFTSEIKTQYLLSNAVAQANYFHVDLEDYVFTIDPKPMEAAFQIVIPIEFIRHNAKIKQNANAEIADITNINELNSKWQKFRDDELNDIQFFKQLKEQNPKATSDIISTTNREFANAGTLRNILEKNLFYHILLKANLGEAITDHTITQLSQLFPDQYLKLNVFQSVIKEEGPLKTFLLTGVLQRDNLSDEDLRRQYDELYKPLIKFSYTEFDYIYNINYTVDLSSGLLFSAQAIITEKIKNNYESITEFSIRKVEL